MMGKFTFGKGNTAVTMGGDGSSGCRSWENNSGGWVDKKLDTKRMTVEMDDNGELDLKYRFFGFESDGSGYSAWKGCSYDSGNDDCYASSQAGGSGMHKGGKITDTETKITKRQWQGGSITLKPIYSGSQSTGNWEVKISFK